jgi:hypothetical protein
MIFGFFLFILVLKNDKILKLIFSNKKNDLVSLKEKINEDIQFIYLNQTKQIKGN